MPTSADLLLDTSAAIPLVVKDNAAHSAVRTATAGLTLGLAGHALFETYSVLTRLPSPYRVSPASARLIIDRAFPASFALQPADALRAIDELADANIAGGAVYDGLVGLAALRSGVTLLSCDHRAATTYARLGVPVTLI